MPHRRGDLEEAKIGMHLTDEEASMFAVALGTGAKRRRCDGVHRKSSTRFPCPCHDAPLEHEICGPCCALMPMLQRKITRSTE